MKSIKIIILLLGLIILSSQVLGFGVTSWLTGPVSVAPGDSKEVIFELQNMIGNEDLKTQIVIANGKDIATIKEGDLVEVPFGVKKNIHVLLNIPDGYKEGQYPIDIKFITIPLKSNSGPVQMGTSVTQSINVDVNSNAPPEEIKTEEIPQTEETSLNSNLGIVGIISMLVILILIILIVKFIHKKR